MKYLTSSLFLLAMLTLNNGMAQNFDLSFNHYAINVSDLETSVIFYEDVFKLTQIPNQTGNDKICWFSIGENLELNIIESDTEHIRLVKGVHLSLTTPKLDQFIEHLNTLDIEYENWSGEKQSFNVRPDGVTQVYIKDPDGYWIEVNDGEKFIK